MTQYVIHDRYKKHMASNRPFRDLKGVVEEIEILENSVPKSTRSVNKWAIYIFGEWKAGKNKL